MPNQQIQVPQEGIRWRVVGGDTANCAITGLSARARDDRRTEFRILVRLANFSAEAREVSAVLHLDGQPIDALAAELAAGEEKAFTVSKTLPAGGQLEVSLNAVDGLEADNVARLFIPPPQPIRVAVVSAKPNWFLEHALSAVPLVAVTRVDPGRPISADEVDLAVFDRVSPAELPPVHSLFLHPEQATPLWRMGEPLKQVLISSLDEDSPLLRYTRFERVAIRAALPIVPEGGRTVMGSFGSPLLHLWDGSEVRRAALTVDLEQSDLALRTAFPILVANLVQWFTGQATGDITGLQPGEDVRFERVGVYELEDGVRCVNLTDAGESDLRQSLVAVEAARGSGVGSRPWWRWLVMAGLALVTVEWGLHQRRWVE